MFIADVAHPKLKARQIFLNDPYPITVMSQPLYTDFGKIFLCSRLPAQSMCVHLDSREVVKC